MSLRLWGQNNVVSFESELKYDDSTPRSAGILSDMSDQRLILVSNNVIALGNTYTTPSVE